MVLVTDFEEVCQPPWSRDVDIALCAGNDKVAFGLHANAKGDGRGGMGEIDDSLGVDINAVFDFGMEINVGVVATKEFDDGEKGERRVLVHGSARLGGI